MAIIVRNFVEEEGSKAVGSMFIHRIFDLVEGLSNDEARVECSKR